MSNADHIRHLTVLASNSPRETREALEAAVEALRAPRIETCFGCREAADASHDGDGPGWECMHDDVEQDDGAGRSLPDVDTAPPAWCPKRPKK